MTFSRPERSLSHLLSWDGSHASALTSLRCKPRPVPLLTGNGTRQVFLKADYIMARFGTADSDRYTSSPIITFNGTEDPRRR